MGYVGYTRWHLHNRVKGHKLNLQQSSAIAQTVLGTMPQDQLKRFEALKKCKNKFDCLNFKTKSQRTIRLHSCESIFIIFAPLYVNSARQNRLNANIIPWTLQIFYDWPKAYSEFSKSAPITSLQIINYHVKNTQGHWLSCHVWPKCMICEGKNVKFAGFVLLPVSEEAKTSLSFFFVQSILIKQLLHSVFVISRIIKLSVRVIYLTLRLRLITFTSTLIILDITKTSSNNCLLFVLPVMNFPW